MGLTERGLMSNLCLKDGLFVVITIKKKSCSSISFKNLI